MCQSPLKVCPGGLCLPLQRPWKNELFAWEYPVPEDSSVRIIYFCFISWKRHPPQHSAAPLWTDRLFDAMIKWTPSQLLMDTFSKTLRHCEYLIEVVRFSDVFRTSSFVHLFAVKMVSVSTGGPQPVSSSQASWIDGGKARAERVVSIAFQSYSKEWYHWSSSARAVSWLYFWCWLTQSLDSCSLVEGGSWFLFAF